MLQVYRNTPPFSVDEEEIALFRKPPILSIPDIRSSPDKRRVSIMGKVEDVSNKNKMN